MRIKCDQANKNGPSGHTKFYIFKLPCIITNDLLKLLKLKFLPLLNFICNIIQRQKANTVYRSQNIHHFVSTWSIFTDPVAIRIMGDIFGKCWKDY